MAKKEDSSDSWGKVLVGKIIVGLVLATSAPWWFTAMWNFFANNNPSEPTPSPTIVSTPEPTPTPQPISTPEPDPTPQPISTPEPIPALEPSPSSELISAPATLEIRKQGYILRAEGCRTTGEVGAVVCGFSIAAESERKELSLNGGGTFLADSTGQRRRASRMDFGGSGSSTSARSFVNPGEVIAGEASFSGVSIEGTSFQSFELGGYSYRDRPTNLTATFSQVPLVD